MDFRLISLARKSLAEQGLVFSRTHQTEVGVTGKVHAAQGNNGDGSWLVLEVGLLSMGKLTTFSKELEEGLDFLVPLRFV